MTTTVHENLTRDEAAERARLVRVDAYDVALDLTTGDEVFGSTTTVDFTAAPGATTFLDCTAAEVLSVTCNGRELDLDEVVGPTRITLPDLDGETTVVVRATMRYLREGRGMHHFRDPSDDRVYLHTQFEPFDAHQVVACFDQPDLKAPVTFRVTVPQDWVVVSNAPVTRAPEDGAGGEWVFEETPRLSPYVWAVVAGEYASVHDRHGDIDLGLYVRQSLREHLDPDELFEVTRQGFDWFNANFGIAYPFGKYDQLFVPEFSAGAMENPGCVTFSESYVFRGAVTDAQRERRAETILHEMAHMWFGDLVTMRWWDDLWLNESFASFSATLSQSEATRFTDAWVTFLDEMKAWAKYQDQLPSTHPIAADMVDIESVHQNFDGITYAKGASVLRQLVAWVGQDDFLAGVRAYFATHQYDNAELSDFLAALEAASGRDLAAWRDAWLTTTGVATMAVEAPVEDGRFTSFEVVQTTDPDHPTIRPHRLAIGIYDEDDGMLVRTSRVEVDVTGVRTPVDELVGAPAGRLVLVNDDDLTYTKVALDPRSLATAMAGLSTVADPMARTLLWSSAWDMVRDGQLAASRYVDLVIAHVAHEDQIGVLTRLAQRAHGAAARYAAREHAGLLLTRLADQASAELAGTTPGSDRQLAWARQLAATATSPEQLQVVHDLRSGTLAHEGLAIDQDLRWRLTVALAREGAIDEADIERELDRDPSDFGQRQAATARAARPTADAKQAAWTLLMDDPDLGQTMARQVWGGFQQLTQPDLLGDFVDRYFAALDTVWATRSTEWAIEFATGMFPHAAVSASLLGTAVATRDRHDLPGPLRRVLAEQVDTLERTLRAREVDATTTATHGAPADD
jgi:aminopeptidase N